MEEILDDILDILTVLDFSLKVKLNRLYYEDQEQICNSLFDNFELSYTEYAGINHYIYEVEFLND